MSCESVDFARHNVRQYRTWHGITCISARSRASVPGTGKYNNGGLQYVSTGHGIVNTYDTA
eukprot:3830283-Rhodomonas_salina.2